jgi:D-alanine-D-alanine ligase
VAPWRTVTAYEWRTDPEAVRDAAQPLGLPAFVKPARAGSSVGVTKITDWAGLDAAMATALAEDDRVLIESMVTGREVEIAVLGGRPGEPARASVAGEIVISGRDFYDFAAKYLDAPGIDLVCPADLTDAQLAEMQELGVRAFDAIGGEGLARVDFFLTADGFVVNEINTMPGFTPISMFPRCWQESGLSYPALIDELIQVALARAAA